MICKWCGAEIAAKDKKCGRCGRDVTPSSDCGGFYDIVPNAKPAAPAAPASVTPAPVVSVAPPPVPQKKKFNLALLLSAVLCVLWLITLFFLIGLSGSMDQFNKDREDLEDKIDELSEQIEQYHDGEDEPSLPETNEPPVTNENPGNENPEKPADAVELAFENTEDAAEVKNEDESVSVKMTLAEEKKDEESAANEIVSLLLNVSEETYGAAAESDSEVYVWKYRVDDGEWLELTEKFAADKATVTYCPEELTADLLAETGTKVELQCVITRTNVDAETLTVTVTGIIVAEKPAVEE
ncbi:MAG: hypothetical protein IJX76_02360 [Clostridia bacterium]|nr:hypothetical protein [Clostridia bacterium]